MSGMQLSWQPGFSLSRKPVKRSRARRTRLGALGHADGPQKFEFVAEHPVRSQRGYCGGVEPTLGYEAGSKTDDSSLPLAHCSTTEHPAASDSPGTLFDQAAREIISSVGAPHHSLSDSALVGDGGSDLEALYRTTDPYTRSNAIQCTSLYPPELTNHHMQASEGGDMGHGAFCVGAGLAAVSELHIVLRSPTSVPPSILYSSLSRRFQPILDRYNREFCKIPLTANLRRNPFQYHTDLGMKPMFLVHAVMSLAGHHIESTSTLVHRHAALQLLRESLTTCSNMGQGYSMLDTIIILFSLDETQSALGNWRTHIMGAFGLVEAYGGIDKWITSARTQVQIGLLTWWDAITSLVNREDCIFPYAYFEAAVSNQNDQEWDYFSLCGCPPSLVEIVMQLARLGAEKRKASSLRYVNFDTTVILELERSLESWHYVSPEAAFQDEESLQQDLDSMHCSEAWRNGLLLYIHRMFQWEPGSSIPMHILCRARVVMDHVVACRDEGMMSRQALLPLFFAGCELRDLSSRRRILQLCSDWNERTRYYMFGTTIPLLKEVWAEQEAKGFENVWWGQIVDRQHSSDGHSPLQVRLCFG
ncbi:hypothetical protein BO94DRAFT_579770 [Aspergillus sclerotioniger CBS 115572]|uniref:Fungal-specific transcription factor domain-containing protein n=1 Tax=Aspergillus sclerotioniger CBS 115572 TaxID=1450535 RepID=A0A317UXH8_9EURO|nr:hypothetical protein BO94DRAFT_579770 [Aspergillus sclerotioniger CBS 115572]PWY66039.1 hypothetical protein BO94DRAFT_579770 [Aspergillus sclerotioniger CBS 115572]